jgi:hypothetical protein
MEVTDDHARVQLPSAGSILNRAVLAVHRVEKQLSLSPPRQAKLPIAVGTPELKLDFPTSFLQDVSCFRSYSRCISGP